MTKSNVKIQQTKDVIEAIFFDKTASIDVRVSGSRITVPVSAPCPDEADFLYPDHEGQTYFLSVTLQEAEIPELSPFDIRPTVILRSETTSVYVFPLFEPTRCENPYLAQICDRFGSQSTDCIPLPGNGWEALFCHGYHQDFEELVTGLFLTEEPELDSTAKHFDADVLLPYVAANYPQPIIITEGRNRESKRWKPVKSTLRNFIDQLCQHREGPKDGPAFVLADMAPGQRLKTGVKTCTAVGLDIDVGTPREVVDAALVAFGHLSVRYSTHSNGRTESEFRKDSIVAFAPEEDITTDLVKRYTREKLGWDDSVVSTISLEGVIHLDRGIMVQARHKPMDKHRIVVPLAAPFEIAKFSSQKEGWDQWARIPTALAARLGLPLDKTCTDPGRLFYFPRHDRDAPYNASLFGGPVLQIEALRDPLEDLAKEFKQGPGGGKKSITPDGQALGKWGSQRADGFQMVDVLTEHCPERIRGTATSGVTIECPFDEGHSNPGDTSDTGCFAVNAAEGANDLFVASCRHENCRRYTNLDMLGKMLRDGWFARDLLDDDRYDAIDRGEGASTSADRNPAARKYHFESRSELIDELNKHCGLVKIGSQTRYIVEADDGIDFLAKQAASDWFMPYKLVTKDKNGDPKLNSGFSVWMNSPERRVYTKVVFQPSGVPSKSHYNLWKGLNVGPKEGDWSLLKAHIYDIICSGELENFIWLISWLAQLVQQPGEKPGTAVALRSGKGTGKSLFATWFTEIFGDHAITMAQANQFVGQFNAHYERAIFAVAEESFWAGSKEAEGALKHLITGETHRIERKGVDSIEVPNFTRVLILGNNEWMVPASEDERRYFVLDVNEVRKQDAEYFIPLIKQARNGGVAAMLYDLLRFDFSKVDLRNPPKTTALRKQLYESMDQERRWWFDVLESGEFVDADGNSTEWPEDNDLEIRRQIVFQSYKDAVGRFAGRNPTPTRVGRFLRKCLPGYDLEGARESSEGRHRQYTLPSLSIARKLYNERTGLPVQAEHAGTQAETALFSLAAAIDRDYAMSLFDGNTYEPTAEDFAEPG